MSMCAIKWCWSLAKRKNVYGEHFVPAKSVVCRFMYCMSFVVTFFFSAGFCCSFCFGICVNMLLAHFKQTFFASVVRIAFSQTLQFRYFAPKESDKSSPASFQHIYVILRTFTPNYSNAVARNRKSSHRYCFYDTYCGTNAFYMCYKSSIFDPFQFCYSLTDKMNICCKNNLHE